MQLIVNHRKVLLMILTAILFSATVMAQSHLNKKISITANKEQLGSVLKKIEKQAGFFFSYAGSILNADSLVSISARERSVRQTLDMLFAGRLEYAETEHHVILKKAAAQSWYASGYVYDRITGEKLSNASVYERRQLVSTMTNEQGYYRLKLKDKSQPAQISISKAWYMDTTIDVKPATEQELTVSIAPRELSIDTIVISPEVEGSWLGKMFLSSRQRLQNINMSKFFVNMPVQVSLTPGLGTHGKMSGQVVNSFSFNVIGGHTAGTNGAEIGCFFNINRKDAGYLQVAGVFNVVGGNVYGTQIGGLYNHVIDSVEGMQIAGIGSMAKGSVHGVQVGGFFNYTGEYLKGFQTAGFGNIAKEEAEGSQIAGFGNLASENINGLQISAAANIAAKEINGVQIGGLFNYAKRLDGVQIGFFNYADTSSGYSLGFLSFVRKGYHKASFSANEVFNVNGAFKTGNTKYYSILFLSANLGKNEAYSYGYGIGREIKLAKNIALAPELSAHYLYLGEWHVNIMARGTLSLQYKLASWFSVFGGPAYSYYYTDQTSSYPDFKTHPAPAGYKVTIHDANRSSWLGWNAGVNIF
jgi:hypothetical protein